MTATAVLVGKLLSQIRQRLHAFFKLQLITHLNTYSQHGYILLLHSKTGNTRSLGNALK